MGDGCAVVRTNLTVSVLCGNCPPSPSIAPLQPVYWSGAAQGFGPISTNGRVPLSGVSSTDFDRGVLYQSPLPSYEWRVNVTRPTATSSSAVIGGTKIVVMSNVPASYNTTSLYVCIAIISFCSLHVLMSLVCGCVVR